MALSQLMPWRKNQAGLADQSNNTALVTAPELNLVRSDSELVLPESGEISCDFSPEEWQEYRAGCGESMAINLQYRVENLRHFLKSNGFRDYSLSQVNEYMAKQVLINSNKLDRDLWWNWKEFSSYPHRLPARVGHVYDKIKYKIPTAELSMTDIYIVSRRYAESDRNSGRDILDTNTMWYKYLTETCFLSVGFDFKYAHPNNQGQDDSYNPIFIIDAWRGPTFKDEEAKL